MIPAIQARPPAGPHRRDHERMDLRQRLADGTSPSAIVAELLRDGTDWQAALVAGCEEA